MFEKIKNINDSGFTIIEVVTAALILSVSAAILVTFYSFSGKNYIKTENNYMRAILAANEGERINYMAVTQKEINDTTYPVELKGEKYFLKREKASETESSGCGKIIIKIDNKNDSTLLKAACLIKAEKTTAYGF